MSYKRQTTAFSGTRLAKRDKQKQRHKVETANLFVVFRRGAQDCEFRATGFGFGRLTGVEEGLDERLQMLSFLNTNTEEFRLSVKRSAHLDQMAKISVGL